MLVYQRVSSIYQRVGGPSHDSRRETALRPGSLLTGRSTNGSWRTSHTNRALVLLPAPRTSRWRPSQWTPEVEIRASSTFFMAWGQSGDPKKKYGCLQIYDNIWAHMHNNVWIYMNILYVERLIYIILYWSQDSTLLIHRYVRYVAKEEQGKAAVWNHNGPKD